MVNWMRDGCKLQGDENALQDFNVTEETKVGVGADAKCKVSWMRMYGQQ